MHYCSYYLPKKVVTNEDLKEIFPEIDPERVFAHTGVRRRHYADNETSSDMSYNAINQLIEDNKIDKAAIDGLICVTQNPDNMVPNTASRLQNMLGLTKDLLAFDLNLACSGFVYALLLAKSIIKSTDKNNILITTTGDRVKYLNKKDKNTLTLFGDGASAFLLTRENVDKIKEFVTGTDGSGYNDVIIKNDDENDFQSPRHYSMNSINVFSFTISVVPDLIKKILEKNNLTLEDIDYFVLHQANKSILEYVRNDLNIEKEKMYINLEETGNTSSSTIPVAFADLVKQNKLHNGMKILIAGYGAGFSWAGTVIEW